jgi:hypothetical protein
MLRTLSLVSEKFGASFHYLAGSSLIRSPPFATGMSCRGAEQSEVNQLPAAEWKPPRKRTTTSINEIRQAPIGHRQPGAKDVPPWTEDNIGTRSPEDEMLDRKLRICRDC